MKFLRYFFIFCGVFLIVKAIYSNVPHDNTHIKAFRDNVRSRVNQVVLPTSNFGPIGYDGKDEWPKGSGEHYIYDMGIWVGTIRQGIPLVSCGYFFRGQSDLCAGPPEHVKDYKAQGANAHPEDSVYFSGEVENEEEWEAKTGNPAIISHEDMWCEYNDMWEDRHAWEPNTGPLGLHIKQTVFGWNTPTYENMMFILYEVINVSGEKLEDVYVGLGCDMDVGWYRDDMIGCDIGRSLGYTYTSHADEWMETSPWPYYIGVRFLEGPRADDTVFVAIHPDSAGYPWAHSDTVLPGSTLVLTCFNKCVIEYDPDSELRRWQMLAGYNIETGAYDPWRTKDDTEGDKRMVLGCGPFDMDPGEVDTFLVAVMYSNGSTGMPGDNEATLNYLKQEGDAAYYAYKFKWVVPGPPSILPKLTATPGDRRVTLIWDNSSEYTQDKFVPVMRALGDTVYRERDFEGYRLFKSKTGRVDDWEELGQWDIKNNIILLPGDILFCGQYDTTTASGKESANKGLVYSYEDTSVYNGITYHYAVTSYDFNTRGNVFCPNESDIWVALETGKKEVLCQPRAEPNNYISPNVEPLIRITGRANTLDLTATIMGEQGITGHQYEIHWDQIKVSTIDTMPIYTYNMRDATEGEFIFPEYFDIGPMRDTITTLGKRDSTVAYVRVDSVPDSIIVERTIAWDTIRADSAWLWTAEVNKPFDGLMLEGKVNVPIKDRKLLMEKTRIDTLVVKPGPWNNWADTVIVDSIIKADTLTDTSSAYFDLPDTILIENDIGPHTYDGKLQVRDFYSSGGWGNPWAYHGGTNIEIQWKDYHGSQDSLTMQVFDISTGVEIPYDSAFGDNWCFTSLGKPAVSYLTGTQPSHYRIQFYISGVLYRFNAGSAFSWDKKPDAGDIWKVYSSTPSIPPSKGNIFAFGTKKFQYGETFNMDLIKVVPNPYLVRARWDRSKDIRKIEFTHLPSESTIRIYTLDGVLIRTLHHNSVGNPAIGGARAWDLLTENDQYIASGIYIYHVSTPQGQSKIGKFAVIVGK